jgi:riboflavin synthase
MFTGIVIGTGTVKRARMRAGVQELEVEAPRESRELKKGDSIAVNGVCLTVTQTGRRRFESQVVPETLSRTTLGELTKGDSVNLELPTRATDRLGGHFVQGHIDGRARVIRIEDDEGARRVWLTTGDDLLRYMVMKGSITLDGVSLTLAEVGRTSFQVALIPHTLAATTLGSWKVGTEANVEVDVLAKYVERLMERK